MKAALLPDVLKNIGRKKKAIPVHLWNCHERSGFSEHLRHCHCHALKCIGAKKKKSYKIFKKKGAKKINFN